MNIIAVVGSSPAILCNLKRFCKQENILIFSKDYLEALDKR